MKLGEQCKLYRSAKSLFISEDGLSHRYHFFPETKEYTDKDTVVGQGSKIEKVTYRINTAPISVDIKKCDESKENGKWKTLQLDTMSPVIFYILFLHPEVLSPERHTAYLSEIISHIETAKARIQAFVQKISPNIYIKTGDVSTYLDTVGYDVGGYVPEESWNKIKHIFDPYNPEFCGLEREMFRRSHLILRYANMFLLIRQ